MDLVVFFLIIFAMILASWLISFIFQERTKTGVITIIIVALSVPFPLILFASTIHLIPPADTEAGSLSTSIIFLVDRLPFIVLSDIGGAIIGYAAGFFTGKRD